MQSGVKRTRSFVTAVLVLATAGVGLLVPTALGPSPARAEEPEVLVVAGPPELRDSGFVDQVLAPVWARSYPRPTAAIDYVALDADEAVAEAAAGRVDVLLLSDPAAESRFVAGGRSALGPGRPMFWTDDVLLGPAADPAGTRAGARRDVVHALELIAASGDAGRSGFVSVGGTSDRAAAEHALWARTDRVPTCTLDAARGGGEVPSTVAGPCPDVVPHPAWYRETGAEQPATVRAAGACADCYTLAGRGTFDRLRTTSGDLGSLSLLVAGNDTAAGAGLLVDSFHAYAVGSGARTDTAKRFVWALTSAFSPEGAYVVEQPMAAFRPSATLRFTLAPAPSEVRWGDVVERSGSVTSRVPGDPPLAGYELVLNEVVCGADHCDFPEFYPLARTRTDADGAFRLRARATDSIGLTVSSTDYADVVRVVDDSTEPALTESFDRISEQAGGVSVRAWFDAVRIQTGTGGRFRVTARLAPGGRDTESKVQLYAARPGQRLAYRSVVRVPRDSRWLNHVFRLAPGTWKVELRYVRPVESDFIPTDVVLPGSHTTRVVLR